MIKFTNTNTPDATVIQFELEGGVISPDQIEAAVAAAPALSVDGGTVDPESGVILSGRGPVWLFGALAHNYHPCAWVATHDPRLGGGVVVARHRKDAPMVGAVVPME